MPGLAVIVHGHGTYLIDEEGATLLSIAPEVPPMITLTVPPPDPSAVQQISYLARGSL